MEFINGNDDEWTVGVGGTGTFGIYDGATFGEQFTIDTSGNVGIGLSSPAFTLDVNGVSRSRGVCVNSGFSNNTARPALSTGSTHPSYEIRSIGGNGNVGSAGGDDGFLRLRAGGGTGTNSASYIDLSGYSVYSGNDMKRNIVFGTLGTERMRILENGNVGIGTPGPTSPLHIIGSDTNANAHFTSLVIDHNCSGGGTNTGDFNHTGILVDLDSTATGGNTSNEHRIYGIRSDTRHSGDSDLCYGVHSYTRSDHASGTNTNLRAGDFTAIASGTGVNTNIYGLNSYALKDGGSTGTTANMYGVRGEVEVDAGTCTTAYAFQAHIDRDAGTITTGYLYYGSYSGTVGTKYGVYVTGETKNYFSGKVGIGNTNPAFPLTIGSSDGNKIQFNESSTPGHNITTSSGWQFNFNAGRASQDDDAKIAFHISGSSGYDEMMRVTHTGVGIGTASPGAPLTLKQKSGGWLNGTALRFLQYGSNDRWDLGVVSNTDDNFAFGYNGSARGYFRYNGSNQVQNFTGQHRTFIKNVPFSQVGDLEGLIVSSDQNKYIKMSGGIEAGSNAITTNESLPLVSLSTKVNDKKCFGVISASEDPETREDAYGNFVTPYEKELGDTRVYINSVGEGAMWVVNTADPLESGDYITTSNVAGYGQRQESEFLANYTVAKITMDCDFNPQDQPIQIIKKELANVNYWVKTTVSNVSLEEYSNLAVDMRTSTTETYYSNEDGEISVTEYSNLESNVQSTYTELTRTVYQKISKEESKTETEGYDVEVREELVNVLDEHGQLQWEDDPSGATEKAYKIRYLDALGAQTDEANAVHIAAFVGCTYHCG